jgi:hypothetical protein
MLSIKAKNMVGGNAAGIHDRLHNELIGHGMRSPMDYMFATVPDREAWDNKTTFLGMRWKSFPQIYPHCG